MGAMTVARALSLKTIDGRPQLVTNPVSEVNSLRTAGVAISNAYPEAKSVGRWLVNGWHVALAYVAGFLVMLAIVGWHPTDKRGRPLAVSCTAVYTVSADCSRIAG